MQPFSGAVVPLSPEGERGQLRTCMELGERGRQVLEGTGEGGECDASAGMAPSLAGRPLSLPASGPGSAS